MNEQRISFETAKLAKEKGFEASRDLHACFYVLEDFKPKRHTGKPYSWHLAGALVDEAEFLDETCCPNHDVEYSNQVDAPTQAELQKWLREVRGVQVYAYSHTLKKRKGEPDTWIDFIAVLDSRALNDPRDQEFETYEEALEFVLFHALERL